MRDLLFGKAVYKAAFLLIFATQTYGSLDQMDIENAKIVTQSNPNEIVFIDQGVDDSPILIDKIRPGIAVHILDNQQDGVLQSSQILQQYANLDAIRIVSHGNSGYIKLGNSALSTATQKKYQPALFTWQSALKQDSDILIYGCDVGKDNVGLSFVQELANNTSSNVAASHNQTGSIEKSALLFLIHNMCLVIEGIA